MKKCASRHSLRYQIAGFFMILVLIAIAMIAVINEFFLEDYYIAKKTGNLLDVYENLQDFDGGTQSIPRSWRVDTTKKNITWVVASPDNIVVGGIGTDDKQLASRLLGYRFGLVTEEPDVLKQTSHYIVQKSKDKFVGMDYLEVWGILDNGNYCLIRSPLESIKESANISNGFYFGVGFLIIMISLAVIWVVTKRITKPICELTELSQRMSQLDFEAKYKCQARNEIDILGSNFNKMADQLEVTISELKAANNELQKDIADKIKIDEMRKEFLNNVSHELKTPIALIQGYAEGLKENISDDEESREFYCDVIMDEASKMNKLVRNLLNLNQLESGGDTVTMEYFDLVQVIQGVIQASDILVRQHEAHVIFNRKEPVYVWADEFKIEEVVTNYFTNALNHLDGEKQVEIKIEDFTEQQIRFSVFNTGNPIPEEDLPNIWNKFYKVDKARTREYGGSGIGLSIVKAIADSLNQKCGVQNYKNGVEFWFTLDRK